MKEVVALLWMMLWGGLYLIITVLSIIIFFLPALVLGTLICNLSKTRFHRLKVHCEVNDCPALPGTLSESHIKRDSEQPHRWCINLRKDGSCSYSECPTLMAYLFVGYWFISPWLRGAIEGFGR